MTNLLYRSQEVNWIELQLKERATGAVRKIFAATRFYPAHSIFGVRCAALDGINDYFSISDNASLSAGTGDFSWCGWVNFDAIANDQFIFHKGNFAVSNATEYALFLNSGGYVTFQIEDGVASNSVTPPEKLVPSRWYFLAFWYDSAKDEIGVQIDERRYTGASANGSQDTASALHIGRDNQASPAYPFKGRMSRFGFWKRLLTPAELLELYNFGQGLGYSELSADLLTSLSAYWNLDESSGTREDSHSTNDLTQNGGVTSLDTGPGNPTIYPLLMQEPSIGFALGPVAAEQINATFSLFGYASISQIFETLSSLLTAYDVAGQSVKVWYASKAEDVYLVNDASFPSLRATLEAISFQIGEDAATLSLNCIDRWFKDKLIGTPIDNVTFPNAWIQEYGKTRPRIWGVRSSSTYGPIASCRWIDTVTDNPYVADYTRAASKFLYADFPNGFQSDATGPTVPNGVQHYVYNKDDPGVGADPWQKLAIPNGSSARALTGLSSNLASATYTTKLNMITYPVAARAFSVSSSAYISTGFRLRAEDKNSNLVDADGPLIVTLEQAEIQNTNNLFLKRTLREKIIRAGDPRILASGHIVDIWDEPIVLLPDVQYAIVVRWERDPTAGATHEIDLLYNPSSPTDTDTFYVKTFGNENFLTKTGSGTGLSVAVDSCWYETGEFDRGQTSGYASLKLWGSYDTGISGGIKFQSCTLKAYMKGAEDIGGAHVYPASTEAIKRPQEIISSLLNSPSVAPLEDSGHFDFAPGDLAPDYEAIINWLVNLVIVLEAPVSVTELVLLICEHSRLRLYKQRDGSLKTAFPFNFDEDGATVISESELRSDLLIKAIGETDAGQIVNDFRALYKRDYLERESDPQVLLRLGTNRYAELFDLKSDTSTDSDTTRQAELEESQDAFGVKEWRRELDFIDTKVPARDLVNYLADRYSRKQKRVTVQLLKREFHALFILSQVTLYHTRLCGSDVDLLSQPHVRDWGLVRIVDEERVGVGVTGRAEIAVYDDGIPCVSLALGRFEGEIIAIQEQGPLMLVTIENIPFIEQNYY